MKLFSNFNAMSLQASLKATVILGLGFFSLSLAQASSTNAAPITNLAELEKSNHVAKQTGMYPQYQKVLDFMSDTPQLSAQDKVILTTMLNSLKGYVLYPYLLAKVITKYPDDYDFSKYASYFKQYFPNTNFTQGLLAATWSNDIASQNYNRVLTQAKGFPVSNWTAQCAIAIAKINKRQASYKQLYTLFNDVVNNHKLSYTCQNFTQLYAAKYKFTSSNIIAVKKYLVYATNHNPKVNLDKVAPFTVKSRSIKSLYDYASNVATDASYVYTKGKIHTGRYYNDINKNNISAYIRVKPYRKASDLTNFIASVKKLRIPASLKQQTISRYIQKYYFRIPTATTDYLLKYYYTDYTLEIKIREKILKQQGYLTYLNKLSREERNNDEWQYWLARVVEKSSKAKARKIFEKVSQTQGFYGLLASKVLNQPYKLINELADKLDAPYDLAKTLPWYDKALHEANTNGNTNLAYTLWANIKVNPKYTGLINWAYTNKIYYLGVTSSIKQGLRSKLAARFPDAYANLFNSYAKDLTVTKTFAQAIARQESAWNYNAQSRAPAYGLMQFINATAKATAAKVGLDYTGPTDLFLPENAIKLGTFHLSELLTNFGNNRALTAIGYNAGPGKITQWLARANGRLSFDEFVATIPYNETRNYVMNTLTFDYYNQVIQGVKYPVTIYNSEWNRKY